MSLQPHILVNDAIPDGFLAGYDKEGRVIVCIQFHPKYEHLFGSVLDEISVSEWHTGLDHANRCQAIIDWNNDDFRCYGEA